MASVPYKDGAGNTRHVDTATAADGSVGTPDINRTRMNDGDLVALGAIADAAAATDTANASLIALFKRLLQRTRQYAIPAAANVNAPAANTDAAITYAAAGAGVSHVVSHIVWSYNAVPTGGRLTISDGATVVFDIAITAAGPGPLVFPTPIKGTANTAMTVRLYAAGAAVTGRINVPGKWTE